MPARGEFSPFFSVFLQLLIAEDQNPKSHKNNTTLEYHMLPHRHSDCKAVEEAIMSSPVTSGVNPDEYVSPFFLTRHHEKNPSDDATTRTPPASSTNNQRTVLESLQLAAATEEMHAIHQRRRGLNMQMEAEINRQLLLNRARELMQAKLLKQRYLLHAANHHLLERELPFPSSSRASAYQNFIGHMSQGDERFLSMNNPSTMMMNQNHGMLTGPNYHMIGQRETLPTLATQQRQFSIVEDRGIAPASLTASNSNKEDDDEESSLESLPFMRLPGSTGGRTKKESKLPASTSHTARILSKPRRPLSAYNFFFAEERHRLLNGMSSTASSSDDGSCLHNRKAILEIRKNLLNRHSMWVPQAKRKHCKTHGKIGFQDLAKQISTKWRNLSPDQMKEYTTLAGIAKKQYMADKDEYYRTKGRLMYVDQPLSDEA
mmetsp:Transcript_28017/g.51027  ORF Transcript_28017/g.51027 Transcript_28017/m.51027 type:complete len:431 (-) Transcript_28017:179-1471(-)